MLAIFDQGAHPPCPAPFNLAQYVLTHGLAPDDKIALSVLSDRSSQDWSYGALRKAVMSAAAALLDQGLTPGDRLLMRIGNSVDFPLIFLGAIWAGIVPVPTSSHLTPHELAPMIDLVRPKLIVHDAVVSVPDTPIPRLAVDQMPKERDAAGPAPCLTAPDTPAYIVFTSGTSAAPRAVVHAHRAIWARQMMWQGWYGLSREDRVLHAGAFNWTFTLGTGLLDPWSCGATALVPAEGMHAQDLASLIKTHKATLFAAAPGVYRRLLRDRHHLSFPHLRHGLSAGEKLSDSIRQDWRQKTGTELHEAFGMSECSTFISGRAGLSPVPASIGKPQPGRRVAILGPDGPVERGRVGTIAIATTDPGLMLGYLNAPPLEEEWFETGDQGEMTPEGEILYHGRIDDILTAGGYRISPLEIEAALAPIEGLDDIAVTEILVNGDTKVIAACYVAPNPLDEERIKAYAAKKLARYKAPRVYMRVDAFPRNPNGKLQRAKLAKLIEAEHGTT